MRIIAPMMILIMMTSTLAGCTGGDPDSGGEMDSDAINDLIDQNLQDFINNTTITVNQEIHHHNNTTIVNNAVINPNSHNPIPIAIDIAAEIHKFAAVLIPFT